MLRMRARARSGFAVITVLMMSALLLLMMLALFGALRAGQGGSQFHYHRVAARQVAEAALTDALAQLSAQPDWSAGFTNKPMEGVDGSYTVTFNQGPGPFDENESVNNYDGTHPHSARGPDSVPAGTALVVVTARVGPITQRLEALVGPSSAAAIEVENAILTSGRIELHGDVRVSAMKSLDDATSVPALVHSNLDTSAPDLITWTPDGGTMVIDGEVSSSGTNSNAVNLSGYVPSGGIPATGAAQQSSPPIDIPGTVAGQSAAPVLTVPITGALNAPAGDSYHSGNVDIAGDLVLTGSSVYIDGDLNIVGSIKGEGAVYVTGNTTFNGSAEINGLANVSLFSQGSVGLFGFDGNRYLDDKALTDPNFQIWLDDGRWALQQMQTELAPYHWTGSGGTSQQDLSSVIGPQDTAWTSYVTGREGATMMRMRDAIAAEPAGPTRDFMVAKLDNVGKLFCGNGNYLGESDTFTYNKFLTTGNTDGLFDAVNDLAYDPARRATMWNVAKQIDFDNIGAAFFQGLVYTNGGFIADNQVTIVGALVVHDNATQSPITLNGQTVNPGDLILKGGSHLTFVEDYFDDGPIGFSSGGDYRVMLWMGQ